MNTKTKNNSWLIRLAIAAIALLALAGNAHSQSQSWSQALCNGQGTVVQSNGLLTTGGAIPLNDILSGQIGGQQQILNLSLLIMLMMLMIVSFIYMVSYIFQLDLLKNLAKAEIGEVIITAIIVFILLGGFVAISSATSGNYLALAGQGSSGGGFGRSTYVDDCTYLVNSSVNLLAPFFGINILRSISESIESATVSISPSAPPYFGFSVSPFVGYGIFDTVLGILDDITGLFILFSLATLAMLGIIYALFPVFLYAGIVLRTLPWTRAAGGAFLGLFIGFYIVFPILLHVFLGGYIPTLTNNQLAAPPAFSSFTSGLQSQNTNTGVGFITYTSNFLKSLNPFYNPSSNTGGYGIINGFIYGILEPASYTSIAIVIAFIISFDITEAMGDLLGAPSLSASGIFNKVL
jgi:hypothetical protein